MFAVIMLICFFGVVSVLVMSVVGQRRKRSATAIDQYLRTTQSVPSLQKTHANYIWQGGLYFRPQTIDSCDLYIGEDHVCVVPYECNGTIGPVILTTNADRLKDKFPLMRVCKPWKVIVKPERGEIEIYYESRNDTYTLNLYKLPPDTIGEIRRVTAP